MRSKGQLLVISGPSGVGKGTVCQLLLEKFPALALSVSATTREPRDTDREGVTYFFKTREQFQAMIDEGAFLEWAQYNGNYYGTPLKAVEEKLQNGVNVLLEIDVQGALKVKEKCPEGIFIFIAPPDRETLEKRLMGRGTETPEEIQKRVAAADWELGQRDKYDYVVVNDALDDTIRAIQDIMQARSVVL